MEIWDSRKVGEFWSLQLKEQRLDLNSYFFALHFFHTHALFLNPSASFSIHDAGMLIPGVL
jgi:hypothetical protein